MMMIGMRNRTRKQILDKCWFFLQVAFVVENEFFFIAGDDNNNRHHNDDDDAHYHYQR